MRGSWVKPHNAVRIGWIDDVMIYLDPHIAHSEAQKIARDTGQMLGTQRQVHVRLSEENRIRDEKRGRDERQRFTPRKMIESSRKRVLWVFRDQLIRQETDTAERAPY